MATIYLALAVQEADLADLTKMLDRADIKHIQVALSDIEDPTGLIEDPT